MDDIEYLKKRYLERIQNEFAVGEKVEGRITTRNYEDFKKEYLPKHLSFYEKMAKFSGRLLKFSPPTKQAEKLTVLLEKCHLATNAEGVMSFAIFSTISIILSGFFLFGMLPVLFGSSPITFFIILMLFFGPIVGYIVFKAPELFANSWRMKASNQMVLCIFYLVTFMRHTSNIEKAIDFAAEHLTPPLSLDMKKIIWDVATERYATVKESLDKYLENWIDYAPEFVESIHLIEGSLAESSEERRIGMLEKALNVILNGTYERMLHYAHNLKSPLTTLNMLGIILPILGLVILPLLVGFFPEVRWYHLFTLYNFLLPLGVFYLGKKILSTRPSGYGSEDITEVNPSLKRFKNIIIPIGNIEIRINPIFVSVFLFFILFVVGISPLIIHTMNPDFDFIQDVDGNFRPIDASNIEEVKEGKMFFLGYREEIVEGKPTGNIIGPFGIGATLIGLFIVLAFGIGIGLFFALRSTNVIKIRNESKKLESEFADALFQLGNRLADGLPAEIAFERVANVLKGTSSAVFFKKVVENIATLGMDVESAIFDEEKGAIRDFPSHIIESSMKVLTQSIKKGPLVASRAVINISEYIKEMHRVDERLKDLLSEVISSLKSQMNFLAPTISAIVVGITFLITSIMGALSLKIAAFGQEAGEIGGTAGGAGDILSILGSGGIATYFFQISVGIYIVELVIILSILVNGIENGVDKLNERYTMGRGLLKTITTYSVMTFFIIILFSAVAGRILVQTA